MVVVTGLNFIGVKAGRDFAEPSVSSDGAGGALIILDVIAAMGSDFVIPDFGSETAPVHLDSGAAVFADGVAVDPGPRGAESIFDQDYADYQIALDGGIEEFEPGGVDEIDSGFFIPEDAAAFYFDVSGIIDGKAIGVGDNFAGIKNGV